MKIWILIISYSIFFLLLFVQRFILNGRGSWRDSIFNNSMYGLISASIFAIYYGGLIQILFLIILYFVGCSLADYIVFILYKYIIFKNQNGKVPEFLSYNLFQVRSELIEGNRNIEIMNKTSDSAEILSKSGKLDKFFASKNVSKDYLTSTIERLLNLGQVYVAYALLSSPQLLEVFINKEKEGQAFQEICFEMFEYIGMS